MPSALVKQPLSINLHAKNKKIVFDDDEAAEAPTGKKPSSGGAAKQRQGGANTGDTKKNKHIKFGGDDESGAGARHHKDKKQQPQHNTNNKHIKFDEAPANGAAAKANKSKHIVFDVDEAEDVETTKVTAVNGSISKANKNNKHIKFDADGEEDEAPAEEAAADEEEEDEDDYFAKREKKRLAQSATDGADDEAEAQKKWYQVFPSNTSMEDCEDMKDAEHMELYKVCKSAFEAETPAFNRRNPSDGRWLQTALHKGTAKDRANAGALLVTSNPLGNLEALGSLIGFTKVSNKSSTDVIAILTDLWKEVLLPPYRKLMSLQMRSKDWKQLRKEQPNAAKQRRIYAYWYFESELKDQYFEFLKNLQQNIQTGQENSKSTAIVAASKLLAYAPEKEQMLLTMLINKLGDPVPKVASKALHHLTEVGHKHPNMCGVIVAEAEKLLFRNNISERAQHFALCFLASIAPAGRPEVCTKLVHICFALFKVLVQRGAVNNRTMQAILRCLQKAILEAKPAEGSTELLTKEMQDTVYRLVHLADIRVSVQTLGLLLQLVSVKTEKSDRFYNALYKKLLDLQLVQVGTKTSAQLLHIVHRAVHIDANVPRAKAFIKRLLQLSLYMPPQMAAGSLIVLHKLLKMRKELLSDVGGDGVEGGGVMEEPLPVVQRDDEELQKFDSDGEEKYEDIKDEDGETEKDKEQEGEAAEEEEKKPQPKTSSWHHAKVETAADEMKVREISASKYDPTHRVPSFAGAEYALPNELLLLREHYHPTVQVFADNILNNKRIDYYGDPLRDFGLAHFLERFAFKNPKKAAADKADPSATLSHKRYVAFGTRGKSVKSLTKTNCTEDEMYIFNFLEQKRKQSVNAKAKKSARKGDGDEDEDDDEAPLKAGEVDDDEFDEYLDGYFGKKAKAAALAEDEADDEDEEEIDFLKELGGELKGDEEGKKRKKKGKASAEDDEDEEDDIDADWGDDDEGPEFDEDDEDEAGGEMSDDEDESIDLNEEDDDDDEEGPNFSDDDEEDDEEGDDDDDGDALGEDSDDSSPPLRKAKKKKASTDMNERSFAKKLKHSDDMSSLFAAADDFAELLEETGKTKGQGTANAVFNKDKSSDKQLKWEEKRRSNSKTYGGAAKRKAGAVGGGNKKHGGGPKKRKH